MPPITGLAGEKGEILFLFSPFHIIFQIAKPHSYQLNFILSDTGSNHGFFSHLHSATTAQPISPQIENFFSKMTISFFSLFHFRNEELERKKKGKLHPWPPLLSRLWTSRKCSSCRLLCCKKSSLVEREWRERERKLRIFRPSSPRNRESSCFRVCVSLRSLSFPKKREPIKEL